MKAQPKRILSLFLAIAICIGMIPMQVFAEGGVEVPLPETEIEEEILSSDVFYIASPSAQLAEGSGETYLLRVGRGGDAQSASTVHIRISDVTAKYGEDYIVRVRETGAAADSPEDNFSLMEMMEEQPFTQSELGSEEELAAMHEKQEAEKANFGYFGKWAVWRDRPIEDIKAELAKGTPWVLRFRSTGSIENKIKFTDLIKGQLELTENDIDHVLLNSDGVPTYHFAHAVDDKFMYTTHVVRDDSWLSTLPFHVQLFQALGWKCPKYLHIGPLMKMDGDSKRKLSKRKDPELALKYYRQNGYPTESVYEYLLTVLNSNFEDWRRANPDASTDEFKFSYKKMNPAGSLFDEAKLCDVSKNVISRMPAEKVYDEVLKWSEEFDPDFAEVLAANKDTALKAFAIGRGGKKPRKDITLWCDAKDYMGFFFEEIFNVVDEYPENFGKDVIKTALTRFCETYDEADEQQTWFDKIKAIAEEIGFCTDMKAYKAEPEKYKGNIADVSMFLRVAVTGKMNSPDMYEVMHILGKDKVIERINKMTEVL